MTTTEGGRDRALRALEREGDASREGWTGRLRARWRVAADDQRERFESLLQLGARLGWPPAQAVVGHEGPLDLPAAGRFGLGPARVVSEALARAALETWGCGKSGRLGQRILESYELPPAERIALAREAITTGLSERPRGSQRTGEISPSGRAAALAGRALSLSTTIPDHVERDFQACLELATGLLSPEDMLRFARESLIPLLQEELQRS